MRFRFIFLRFRRVVFNLVNLAVWIRSSVEHSTLVHYQRLHLQFLWLKNRNRLSTRQNLVNPGCAARRRIDLAVRSGSNRPDRARWSARHQLECWRELEHSVTGNGDTVRDFLHVEDVVDAYLSLIEQGTPGEIYNVCSGVGVSIRALAESVLQRIGVPADISSDPALTRPVDVPVQIGSNAKLRRATGWTPRRTREDIIDDLIHAATR